MATKYLTDHEQSAIVFAARYAHTRRTGAAFMVVNAILSSWDKLKKSTKFQLKREADSDATCNFSDWKRLTEKEI